MNFPKILLFIEEKHENIKISKSQIFSILSKKDILCCDKYKFNKIFNTKKSTKK